MNSALDFEDSRVASIQDAAFHDQTGIPANAGEIEDCAGLLRANFRIGSQGQRITDKRLHACCGWIADANVALVIAEQSGCRNTLISIPGGRRDWTGLPDGSIPVCARSLCDRGRKIGPHRSKGE